MGFDMLFGILIFDPKSGFCMGYSLWKMVHFQNSLISRIFFFQRFSAENNAKLFVEMILTCLLEFDFLTQSQGFGWPIAFACWLIFKMFSVLEYLVFFRAVFSTEQL